MVGLPSTLHDFAFLGGQRSTPFNSMNTAFFFLPARYFSLRFFPFANFF